MDLCPQCGVNPPRRRITKFNGRTLCSACRQANERANWLRQAALRSQQAAERLGRVDRPLMCPRCHTHPPRFPPRTLAASIPLCQSCFGARWAREYARRDARRVADDIPAAEIERRFTLALSQIRRRAWTLPTSLS